MHGAALLLPLLLLGVNWCPQGLQCLTRTAAAQHLRSKLCAAGAVA